MPENVVRAVFEAYTVAGVLGLARREGNIRHYDLLERLLPAELLAHEVPVGRRAESFRGRELADEEKVPVLRAYLRRWKAEVGIFFEGTGPDSTDDQLRAIAPNTQPSRSSHPAQPPTQQPEPVSVAL